MQLFSKFSKRISSLASLNFLQRISKSQANGPLAQGEKFITLDEEYLSKFDDIVVIGDIHGCCDEFEELLQKVHSETPSKNSDKCLKIIVGDLVNKGPKSKKVLEICANNTNSILSVRGNHDEIVLNLYQKYKRGFPTEERNKWIEKLPKSYVEYLERLPYSITIPSLNCIIVHAGVDPSKEKPAVETPPDQMVSMRNIEVKKKGDGTYYDCTKENRGAAWATFWPGPEHVYFGHDAKRRLQDDHEFATGLDTGCVYGDRLSYIYLKGSRKGEIASIKAKQVYEAVKGELFT